MGVALKAGTPRPEDRAQCGFGRGYGSPRRSAYQSASGDLAAVAQTDIRLILKYEDGYPVRSGGEYMISLEQLQPRASAPTPMFHCKAARTDPVL